MTRSEVHDALARYHAEQRRLQAALAQVLASRQTPEQTAAEEAWAAQAEVLAEVAEGIARFTGSTVYANTAARLRRNAASTRRNLRS